MKTTMIPKMLFLLLCFCWSSPNLVAQFTITGQVVFGETQEPIPDYEVSIFLPLHNQHYSVKTDKEGYYTAGFDWTSAEILEALVQVVDFCTGAIQEVKLPGPNNGYVANFQLCMGINPPPPPPGCEAHFSYEQLEVNPPRVLFFDLSYSSDPEIFYFWDFGDGTTSQEPAPTHEFPSVGVYQVSLTIRTDNCTSTITQTVLVVAKLDCFCPAVYNPVCLTLDDGTTITFSNACEAACVGFQAGDWTSCEPNNCFCPEFYDPVCTIGPAGDSLTFSNRCFAQCAGYGPDEVFSCNPINDCNCDQIFDPVCVVNDGGEILRFPNACLAKCAGYPASALVDCVEPCICPQYYSPVCAVVNGDTLTFSNICFAQCEGYGPDEVFACNPDETCNCPDNYDPVCVIDSTGQEKRYSNACEAECAGFGPDEYQPCDPEDCICPAIYDPVCVLGAQGDTLTFSNSCVAICAGYQEEELFKCSFVDPCNCDSVYDPVCVYTPNGTILRFANSCEARCQGYDENVWVKCNESYCQAQFRIEKIADLELSIQFNNHSEPMNDPAIQWIWDFGDGTIGEESSPLHHYQKAGVYGVSLTMISPAGCTSTYQEQVVVGGPDQGDCKAMFFFDQDPNNPYFFQFYDKSLGPIVSWQWYFGDGTTSNEPAPQHTYTQAGIYIVSLSVMAADGCTNLVSMLVAAADDIVYNPDCHALFLPLITPDSNQVFFLNFSTAGVLETHWDFGDGSTSDQLMPAHTYASSGIFTVTLTIVTESGCKSSYSATINIAGANFTATPAYAFRTTTATNEQSLPAISVRLFPNPVSTDLWLDLDGYTGGDLQWRIVGLNGQTLLRGQQELPAGQQRFSISAADLPAGVYALQLIHKSETITKKFVKSGRK